ncbi:2-C-methyl-D-erythritol 4-phosphate cytidylyltransferase, chloroplastic [Galdieria sulphuraria]|nr:2-C-methyl-D-erythritol 4-phosphate cytidylyltransferase, chloroplastic [Galdieria sulphuraria]
MYSSSSIAFLWRSTVSVKQKEYPLFKSVRHSCANHRFWKFCYPRRPFHSTSELLGRLSTVRYYLKLPSGSNKFDKLSCCSNNNNGRESSCSVILLAGGSGKRMNSNIPKQYLLLHGKPVLEYSLELFLSVFLCPHLIQDPRVEFACPGKERQDSVYNGLQKVKNNVDLVCIHDAARPLVSKETIEKCFSDAAVYGAAVVGVPSKSTIKESVDGSFVYRTLDRTRLWEIQTPQVIRPELLRRGFVRVNDENVTVTDDVSIVEKLGEPVKLTLGEYSNIKLTTEEDLKVAEYILLSRKTETVETAVNS